MNFGKRLILFFLPLLLLALFPAFHAEAATYKNISSVSIRTRSRLELGDSFSADDLVDHEPDAGQVGIWVSNDRYYLDELKLVSGSTNNLKIGQAIKVKAILYVYDSGTYRFKNGFSSSNVSLGGNGAKCTAVSRTSDRLTVTIEIGAVKGQYEPPDDAWWASGIGKAKWSRAENGSGHYELQLKRGGTVVQTITDVTGTSYDLYPYMTVPGNYSFAVRTVPFTASQKQYGKSSVWMESFTYKLDAAHVSDGRKADNPGTVPGPLSPSAPGQGTPASGGSGPSGTGSQVPLSDDGVVHAGWIQNGGAWYYRYPDGSYQKDSWAYIQDKWYSFDADGRMRTGWYLSVSGWYYLDGNGQMLYGWQNIGGKRYYLEEDPASPTFGRMLTGLITTPDGKCWYLQDDGSCARGWARVGDHWSYFSPETGEMLRNTVVDTFYVDADGVWRP